MIKKAILGGTFDPIHNGHIQVAYEALYKLQLDKVVFMPAGNPPHKLNRKITDAEIRFNLVKKIVDTEARFEIEDYEVKKSGFSYTYETLEYLNNKEPSTEWYFVCGVDCLIEMEMWKNTERILELCRFVVFSRPGYTIEEINEQKKIIEDKYSKKIIYLDMPLMEISSSEIRKKVEEGKSVSYLVPFSVNEYIKQNRLYCDSDV